MNENNNISFAVGNLQTLDNMQYVHALQPFSDDIIDFLSALSKRVMSLGKGYSDVMTFGFWCRSSSVAQMKKRYENMGHRLGRGVIFHIAPSNVPVNFAFSLVAGLLAGNANVVRLPSKNFEQTIIICQAINELLSGEYKNMADYICVVQYPHDKNISDYMSQISDTRIIWGGDATIAEVRQSPLKPRGSEITFADRFSIAVIGVSEYLNLQDKEKFAQDFYNDTFFSDQNACTSPRIIIWLGENPAQREKAQDAFWTTLQQLVEKKYSYAPIQAVGKLNALFMAAAEKNVEMIPTKDFSIIRVKVEKLDETLMNFKYNSGFFFEYYAEKITEILPLCISECQTVSYYGVDRTDFESLIELCPRGIDRIVPVGKTMDFDLIWDGYDLIRNLSREISLE